MARWQRRAPRPVVPAWHCACRDSRHRRRQRKNHPLARDKDHLPGAPATVALAQLHVHPAPAAASTNAAPTQRYATDATLREQMREIRGNVLALERHGHGRIPSEVATRLADQVTGHVNTIIVNCKLPPDA